MKRIISILLAVLMIVSAIPFAVLPAFAAGDKVCTVCGEIVEKGTATEKAAHTPGTAVEENKTEATCVKAGSYDEVVYCTVCETEISRTTKTIPAKGHPDKDGNGYCDIDNEKITDTTMKEIVLSMSVGDLINYGSYPQTDVTDEMGDVLTAAAPSTNNWTSYNYYKNGKKSDYMKYYDLTYNGSRYRGVYFASYRPPYWSSSRDNYDDIYIYQDDNGYNINTIYWFRYDPLTWRILEPDTGYVICENIIDSQAFNDEVYFDSIDNDGIPTVFYNDKTYTHFANNWEYSTIRKWLNDIFYATAFSVSERNQIPYTKLTTPAFSSLYAEYDVGETEDYVFLPSYQDVLNTEYGFSSDYSANDINRKAYSSDYAKSQGVLVGIDSYNETAKEEDSSYWALRSSGDDSLGVMFGCPGGCVDVVYDIYVIVIGVRPALCFNPSSIITHEHTPGMAVEENKTDATCETAGSYDEVVYCTVCEEEISRTTKTIPAKGHADKNGDGFCDVDNVNICSHATTKIINEKTATCTATGYTGDKVCTVCGTTIEAGKTTDKAAHSYTSVVTASTCRTKGYTTYNCNVCGYSYKDNYTDTTAHSYNAVVTAATCRTKGYTTYTCKYCGDSYRANETDYAAHDYRKTVVKPTCTNQGYTMYSCNNCSDSYVTDFVAENGHNYAAKVTPATCQREGYTIFTCTVCGDNYKGNITPIAEHNYHVDVIPATCTEKGGRIYVCKVCDYSYSTVISATGHVDKDQNGFCDTCGENLKNAQKNCSHMCHKKGFMGFLWKIVNFFNKLFKINPYCSCGAKHW